MSFLTNLFSTEVEITERQILIGSPYIAQRFAELQAQIDAVAGIVGTAGNLPQYAPSGTGLVDSGIATADLWRGASGSVPVGNTVIVDADGITLIDGGTPGGVNVPGTAGNIAALDGVGGLIDGGTASVVFDGDKANAAFRLQDSGGNGEIVELRVDSANGLLELSAVSDDDLAFLTNDTERIRLHNGGGVSIGPNAGTFVDLPGLVYIDGTANPRLSIENTVVGGSRLQLLAGGALVGTQIVSFSNDDPLKIGVGTATAHIDSGNNWRFGDDDVPQARVHVDQNGAAFGLQVDGSFALTSGSFGAGDTTPNVSAIGTGRSANIAPTTITAFDAGGGSLKDGQHLTFIFGDTFTTLQHSAGGSGIKLLDGKDYTGAVGDTIGLVYDSATNLFVETGRVPASVGDLALSGGLVATDTTVTLNRPVPFGGTNLGWIVLSPYTTNCEIRKIEGVSGDTVTVAALNNAHSDQSNVMLLVTPRWPIALFGAVFDGVTNDAPAVQAAIDDCPADGLVDMSGQGTALLSTQINISKSVNVVMTSGLLTLSAVDLFVYAGDIDTVVVDGIRTTGGGQDAIVRLPAGNTAGVLEVVNCIAQAGAIAIRGSVTNALLIDSNVLGDPLYAGVRGKIQVAPTDAPEFVRKATITNNIVHGDPTASVDLYEVNGVTDAIIFNHNRGSGVGTNADVFDLDAGSRYAEIIGNRAENADIGFEIKNGTRHDGEVGEIATILGNYALECNRGMIISIPAVVQGNTITTTVSVGTVGISYTVATGGQVIGNTIISSSQRGVLIDTGATDLYIAHNLIVGPSEGVSVASGNNHHIVDNTITGSTPVYLTENTAGSGLTIEGNRLTSTGDYCVRVREGGPWTDVLIRDNYNTGFAVRPVQVLGASVAVSERRIALPDGNTTPNVAGGGYGVIYDTANTGSINDYTDFLEPLDGQLLEIHVNDDFTGFVNNANINLQGGVNFSPAPSGTILVLRSIDGVWKEVSRNQGGGGSGPPFTEPVLIDLQTPNLPNDDALIVVADGSTGTGRPLVLRRDATDLWEMDKRGKTLSDLNLTYTTIGADFTAHNHVVEFILNDAAIGNSNQGFRDAVIVRPSVALSSNRFIVGHRMTTELASNASFPFSSSTGEIINARLLATNDHDSLTQDRVVNIDLEGGVTGAAGVITDYTAIVSSVLLTGTIGTATMIDLVAPPTPANVTTMRGIIIGTDYDEAIVASSGLVSLSNGAFLQPAVALADADATPSVAALTVAVTANTGPTTITNLDDPTEGQIVELHAGDSNTTVQHGANIVLDGAADYVMTTGNVLTVRYRSSAWREVSRSVVGSGGGGAVAPLVLDLDTPGSPNDDVLTLISDTAAGTGRALVVEFGAGVEVFTIGREGETLIDNNNPANVALTVQGASGQTADLLQLQGSGGGALFGIDEIGGIDQDTASIDVTAAGRTVNDMFVTFTGTDIVDSDNIVLKVLGRFDLTASPTGARSVYGAQIEVDIDDFAMTTVSNPAGAYGIEGRARVSGDLATEGRQGRLTGIRGVATINNLSGATNATAVEARVDLLTGGDLTNAYGFWASMSNAATGISRAFYHNGTFAEGFYSEAGENVLITTDVVDDVLTLTGPASMTGNLLEGVVDAATKFTIDAAGDLIFADTDHFGLEANTLTTGQRDALTGRAAVMFYNSTKGMFEWHDGTEFFAIAPDVTKGLVVVEPAVNDESTMIRLPRAFEITELVAVLRGGTSTPSVTWTLRHATDVSGAGTEVVTGGTVTTNTTTGQVITTFNSSSLPAGSFIWLEVTAQSGTVPELFVQVRGKE